MILYHVVTYYQLLWVIVYHMTQKKELKAVIIMANSLESRLSNEIVLKISDLFEIYFFPYDQVNDHLSSLDIEELSENVQEQVVNLYNEYIKYDLSLFDEINIAGYHFYFSLVLLDKGIHFNVIEEAAGMLSRHQVLYSIVEKLNPYQLEIALYNRLLYADNELIDKRFCLIECQEPNYVGRDMCNFDLILQIKNNSWLEDLLITIFVGEVKKYKNSKNSVLLLTQHFANLQVLSFEDQALIYQYIVDYFYMDKQLIIKPHPDDVMFYSKLFPKAQIIREKFPSELLPFMFEKLPDSVSTVSSTAIFSIENVFNNVIKFSVDTEKNFVLFHRYFVALYVLKQLDDITELQCLNCDVDIINNLLKYAGITERSVSVKICHTFDEIDLNRPIIIGTCKGDYFSDSKYWKGINICSLMIINCDYQYDVVEEININSDNVLPIIISKSRLRSEYVYADDIDEIFYFVSTKKEIRKMANDIEIQRKLHNAGIEIKKNKLSDIEIELWATKGILQATEMRLKYALEKQRELENEIEKITN
ncbi:MAG: hypothetical protein J6K43_09320 [Lachnospiraceae bacterium]|nr:hypothetical protein [Lachnospiraceae bacterium]